MLQDIVQVLDDFFAEFLFGDINHIVDGSEMMNRFDDVIDRDSIPGINGGRFKNHARLIFRQPAAFDVVGIVCHAHLELMVDSAGNACILFFAQLLKKWIGRNLAEEVIWLALEISSNFLEDAGRKFLSACNLGNCAR